MPLAPGTKLGPYEIVAPLGAGGMGEVYRARDTRLDRDVAIKILPDSFARDSDRLRRFEQEARSVAALNHPNILAIHDIGEQAGSPFIVSELLDGSSLRAELDNGPLPSRKASDYAAQIAQGLAAAHEKNIVHRDLKPENVFITRDGRVKILDFGLAKLSANPRGDKSESDGITLTSSPTEAGVVMGTAGYMAPEQVRGAAVDARTDIFAFGAVLYEMLSGQRAFRRDTSAETMTAILKEDPPELSELKHPVAPGLERIVRRCLEKQPEQRFQSAKDLAFALEALSGTTSRTSAHAAIAAEPEARPKSRWIGIATAAIGLVLGAVLAWFLHPKPAPPPAFTRVSYNRGEVIRARFAPDGQTVFYSAKLEGKQVDTYIIREDYPDSVSAGLHGSVVLAISKQGQMAVLVHPQYYAHYQWRGTLAVSPLDGGAPREILENVLDADWSADGNEMAVIDGGPGHYRLQYPVGKVLFEGTNWISDARISPDGQNVALFHHPPNNDDRGELLVIDRSGKAKTLSSGWESLEGLAWSPSGKEVWFSAAVVGEQYCLRAATLSGSMRTIHCGTGATRLHDLSRSGRTLVSTDESRTNIGFIEHGSHNVRDLTWLNFSYGPSLSSDGSTMLFTDLSEHGGNNYTVYARKTDGSPAVRLATGGFGTDISPNGKWAIVLLSDDPEARLRIVPVGPGEPRAFHWDGLLPVWAGWFPDGKRILLAAIKSGQARTFVTDSDGTAPKQVSDKASPWEVVSSDGRSYSHKSVDSWNVVSVDGSGSKPLPGISTNELPIGWSSDGKSVFVQQSTDSGINVYRVAVETGRRELWQAITPQDQIGLRTVVTPASITPDGRYIAFNYRTVTGELYRSDMLK